MSLEAALARLQSALDAEREALIGLDGEALRQAGESKLAALDDVGAQLQAGANRESAQPALDRAFAQHQSNAALLQRRRQETRWLLQTLGVLAPPSDYDAQGGRGGGPQSRRLAEA